jgi:ABC-type molybdate transport system substrate-binding protein
MRLPRPPERYDPLHQSDVQRQVEQEDAKNYKKDQDAFFGKNRIILTAPNGTKYAISVSNSGALSATAV